MCRFLKFKRGDKLVTTVFYKPKSVNRFNVWLREAPVTDIL